MADLKKWFPFKFKRNEEKPAESKQNVPARATAPGGWGLMGFPQMDRLMQSMFNDDFFRQPFAAFRGDDAFFGDFSPAKFSPNVDIVDEGDFVKVSAELPGLSKDDVELSVHEGVLSLTGHKKHEEKKEEEGCYRTERYYGSFSRTIPLPRDLDYTKSEAKFDKGVLTVRFPKVEHAPAARTIEVK